MTIFLGIDGGGSSTRAVLADADGAVLAQGVSGPSNLLSVGPEAAAASVEAAVADAWRQLGQPPHPAAAACLGMAGMVGPAQHAAYHELATRLALATRIAVTSDLHIALTGGLGGGPGLVLISGTGSSCLGRDATGRTASAGGKGALAGDSGSGFWIGHRALRAAVKQMDGRWASGPLQDVVLDFLGIQRPEELVEAVYGRGLATQDLATLAPRVVELATSGDAVSARIIEGACQALVEMAVTVVRKLDLTAPALILSGGVATSVGFARRLTDSIRECMDGVRFVERMMPPAAGAVLEAMAASGVSGSAHVVERLTQTAVPAPEAHRS